MVTFATFFAILVKSVDIKRFVLLSTVVVGLSALAPFWTGEPAEALIEDRPGFDKQLLHEHEELAEKATVFSVLTSVLAGPCLLASANTEFILQIGLKAVFVASLISSALMAAAAHEGGKIQHPEIRSSAASG